MDISHLVASLSLSKTNWRRRSFVLAYRTRHQLKSGFSLGAAISCCDFASYFETCIFHLDIDTPAVHSCSIELTLNAVSIVTCDPSGLGGRRTGSTWLRRRAMTGPFVYWIRLNWFPKPGTAS
jgi:hypothetical protein